MIAFLLAENFAVSIQLISIIVFVFSEKVMYATLDMPPSEQETCVKEELVSSTKLSDQSNLTYAQIDFDKPSSSSPSK